MKNKFDQPSTALLVLIFSVVMACNAQATEFRPLATAGYLEKIRLMDTGELFTAKLDTGADTSSINARLIKRFKKDGLRYARFELMPDPNRLDKPIILEKERVRRVKVSNANGTTSRYVVKMDICFNGKVEAVEFSLAERGDLGVPVLLGRLFLSRVAVVDSRFEFLTTADCKMPAKKKLKKKN